MLLLLLAAAPPAPAQTFTMPWICSSRADSTSQVWFRRTFTRLGAVSEATVRLTTTGYAQLYVNGRNVSAEPVSPCRMGAGAAPLTLTYDVAAFMRPDSVTIAVWYAPPSPRADSCQIALTLDALLADGSRLSLASDSTWLWREASHRLRPGGGETVDGRLAALPWSHGPAEWALWTGARAVDAPSFGLCPAAGPPRWHVAAVVSPLSLTVSGDSLTAIFAQELTALPRVTLRGARPGSLVHVGNVVDYVCSGDIDEQAFPRFAVSRFARLVVTGDAAFRPDMVQAVEAVALVPAPPPY